MGVFSHELNPSPLRGEGWVRGRDQRRKHRQGVSPRYLQLTVATPHPALGHPLPGERRGINSEALRVMSRARHPENDGYFRLNRVPFGMNPAASSKAASPQ